MAIRGDGDERDDVRQEVTTQRPAAALWMSPDNPGRFFTDADRHRMEQAVRLVRECPVSDVNEPGLKSRLAEVQLLVTGWGAAPLDGPTLDLMPRLTAVVHAAGTVKGFVGAELFERGVAVSTAAEENARPVAEYTLAVIILGLKRAVRFAAQLNTAEGTFRSMDQLPPVGPARPTIGVVGASRIGRRVIRLLNQVLDSEVLLHDPYIGSAEAQRLGARLVPLETLCASSQVVTLHAPNNPDTQQMIGQEQLGLMEDGAILVNTARGGLVDTKALGREVLTGRIDAFLDVTDPEPVPQDSPLRHQPNVFLTPHIAGALGEEVFRLGRHAVDEVERFAAGLPFRDPVQHADLGRIA